MTDKKQENRDEMPRGPLGDARPDAARDDNRTGGGQPQEKVEDRPVVGTVEPEDYPAADRAQSAPAPDKKPD
jgi:hypothetical protein